MEGGRKDSLQLEGIIAESVPVSISSLTKIN